MVRRAGVRLQPDSRVTHGRREPGRRAKACHHACDQADYEVAEDLLRILETMLTRRPTTPDGNRRRNIESLVAAHERLWMLKHPEVNQG